MRQALALGSRRGRWQLPSACHSSSAWRALQDAQFATDDKPDAGNVQSSAAQDDAAAPPAGRGRGVPADKRAATAPGAPPAAQRTFRDAAPGSAAAEPPPQGGRGRATSRLADNLGLRDAAQGAQRVIPPMPLVRQPYERGDSRRRQPELRRSSSGERDQPWMQARPSQQLQQHQQQQGSRSERQPATDPSRGRLRGPLDNQPADQSQRRRPAAGAASARPPVPAHLRRPRPGPGLSFDDRPSPPARQPPRMSPGRSDDEREYRPPRRSRQFDDEDDEPSERELDTIRAEYMGFPPRADIQKVFEEQRMLDEIVADDAAQAERAVVDEATIEALTAEDWEVLNELNEQLAEWQVAGLIPSDEQVKQYESLTIEARLKPADPQQADYRWDHEEIRDFHRAMEMDYDQEYNMSIGTTPRRRTEEERDPAKVLETFKPMLMEQLGINSETEWAQQAATALVGLDGVKTLVEGHDAQREELTLDEMVASALPRDHPMYTHIASSLEEVKRNPFWRPEQKQKFVGGLLKEVTR